MLTFFPRVYLLFALLAPALLLASPTGDTLKQDATVSVFTKTVERVFAVTPSGKLSLDHRYGDIVYKTWAKPEVRLVITISVDAPDQKRADGTFSKIDFEYSAERSAVAVKTLIASQGGSSGMNWWSSLSTGGNNNAFEIDFEIWAPAGFSLDAVHRYGDIHLPDMHTATAITLAYGDLTAAALDDVNRLSISYGNARILRARSLESKVRYGKLEIGGATLLSLDSRYSEVKLGRIGTLNINAGYDDIAVQSVRTCSNEGNYLDLRVDSATSIRMAGNYTDIRLGYLAELGDFKLTYGDVHIGSTSSALQNIVFAGSYSDLFAQLPKGFAFKLDAHVVYGDINVPTGLVSSCQIAKSNTQTLQGHLGTLPQATIVAKTSYGDITIR